MRQLKIIVKVQVSFLFIILKKTLLKIRETSTFAIFTIRKNIL